MTQYREILRLKSLGFSERNIALSVPCSRNTVSKVVKSTECVLIKYTAHLNSTRIRGGFKLFISDLGLLGAMSDVTSREILTGENYFTEYKGAFTEQFVAQELAALDQRTYYSKEISPLEIDFLVQKDELYPIEVKAEVNLRSKSLRTLYDEDKSLKPCRFSMAGYKEQDWMVNVPLYLAQELMSVAE